MGAKYTSIVADPPWSFGDKLPGETRGAARNYKVMTVADVCGLARSDEYAVRVGEDAPRGASSVAMCGKRFKIADDAILFLWRVASQVEEAYRVVRAWGFVPKSEIVWLKTTHMVTEDLQTFVTHKLAFGMGRYVRNCHEVCIIAARGKGASIIQSHSERSVFYAERETHSQKPGAFFQLVERLAPGPRLELFARKPRAGWTCVGNEIGVAKA